MFKKSLIFAALLIFVSFTSIYAVSTTNPKNVRLEVQEKIQEREQKLEQIRETKQIRVASMEAKLNQIKTNAIKKYYTNMSQRISATISRLNTLIVRINSRIAKIESGGTPVNQSVKDEITKAVNLLADSSALLTSSNNMLEETLSSNQPKDAFNILKENITDIKTNLKEVHSILVHVIGELKGLRVGNTDQLTPTQTPIPTEVPAVTPV